MHTPLIIHNKQTCNPNPWHPSVIYRKEGWNGHRFWMAQTPFPPNNIQPYRDYYELPCIHFSDDGKEWFGINNNPIECLDEASVEAHNYYSDPHLLIKDGNMECYYRYTFLKDKRLEGNKTLLLKKTSKDGINWSERETIADLRQDDDIAIWGTQIISPAIVYNDTQYLCWFVDKSSYLQNRNIKLCTSLDGKNWNPFIECKLDTDIDPWHIDVQYNDGNYQLIVYDMDSLYWFESKDGISFSFVSKIIHPTHYFMDFFAEGLYRSCSVKVDNKDYLYFSAKNAKRTSIGLLVTNNRKQFSGINGISQIAYLRDYIWPQLSKKNIKRIIKHIITR